MDSQNQFGIGKEGEMVYKTYDKSYIGETGRRLFLSRKRGILEWM